METTYKFSAHNTESIYGYGSESEATIYLEWLNQSLEINLFEMSKSGMSDEEADTLAINLIDNLNDLDLIDDEESFNALSAEYDEDPNMF